MGWDSKEKLLLNRDGPNCHLPARELISWHGIEVRRHRTQRACHAERPFPGTKWLRWAYFRAFGRRVHFKSQNYADNGVATGYRKTTDKTSKVSECKAAPSREFESFY